MPRKPRDPAWMPADYAVADVYAVKALAAGEATPEQQRRALAWLVERAAGTYELSFRSNPDGGDRETAFAEGRRWVGMQLVKLMNLPGDAVAKLAESERKPNGGRSG